MRHLSDFFPASGKIMEEW
jgi:hypothetical protein